MLGSEMYLGQLDLGYLYFGQVDALEGVSNFEQRVPLGGNRRNQIFVMDDSILI